MWYGWIQKVQAVTHLSTIWTRVTRIGEKDLSTSSVLSTVLGAVVRQEFMIWVTYLWTNPNILWQVMLVVLTKRSTEFEERVGYPVL